MWQMYFGFCSDLSLFSFVEKYNARFINETCVIHLDGEHLKRGTEDKDLRVTTSSSLSWDTH